MLIIKATVSLFWCLLHIITLKLDESDDHRQKQKIKLI